jgi:hypothetical protein
MHDEFAVRGYSTFCGNHGCAALFAALETLRSSTHRRERTATGTVNIPPARGYRKKSDHSGLTGPSGRVHSFGAGACGNHDDAVNR